MYNLWKRSYVQTFEQRPVFESKTILADSTFEGVVVGEDLFVNGGKLAYRGVGIDEVLNTHFAGSMSNLFATMLADSDSKWAVAVDHDDYYYVLAHYLKELQHTYKLTDPQLYTLAHSFLYDNFYYSNDAKFVDGFVSGAFASLMSAVFNSYTPTGVLDLIKPVDLPTEIGYFLIKQGIITEQDVHANFVNAAKMIVARLWQVHLNDFSEWLVLDTKHFLNMMKAEDTPAVVADDISFADMLAFMKADKYLNAMFFQSFPFFSSSAGWENDANFKVTASRIVNAWQKLADYLIARGLDAEWAQLRHSQYTEIILRYDYVKTNCDAVKYLLKLDDAPETLPAPLIDMLGYDVLSECMDSKYNKTLLLLTLRGSSPTFQSFVDTSFGAQ